MVENDYIFDMIIVILLSIILKILMRYFKNIKK